MHTHKQACLHPTITLRNTSLMQSACTPPHPPAHRPCSCMPQPSPSHPQGARMAHPMPSRMSSPPPACSPHLLACHTTCLSPPSGTPPTCPLAHPHIHSHTCTSTHTPAHPLA